jgi:hypothetical protein
VKFVVPIISTIVGVKDPLIIQSISADGKTASTSNDLNIPVSSHQWLQIASYVSDISGIISAINGCGIVDVCQDLRFFGCCNVRSPSFQVVFS